MYDAFFEYLKKFSTEPLTEEEKALIRLHFTPFKRRKRQFSLQAGDVCRNFAFVVKGAMRMYSVDDKGLEHTVRLGVEEWWMGDFESFFHATPSRYNIEAWEHCELLYISRKGVDELQKSVPAYAQMRLQLDARNIMANNRRLTSAISSTADKRYSEFIECYPALAGRFPQHIIASYLGVNKDTLSRVKRYYKLK